jgi:hypothetical protein
MKDRVVLILKHGRRNARIHELDCPWLNGPRASPDWASYRKAMLSNVQGRHEHCSHCA